MGVSENSVPLNPMVLLIIIPIFHGYFIGNIPCFQTNPCRNFTVPFSSTGLAWALNWTCCDFYHAKTLNFEKWVRCDALNRQHQTPNACCHALSSFRRARKIYSELIDSSWSNSTLIESPSPAPLVLAFTGLNEKIQETRAQPADWAFL